MTKTKLLKDALFEFFAFSFFGAVLVAGLWIFLPQEKATAQIANSGETALKDNLSMLGGTDGYCLAVGTSAVNLLAPASLPARVSGSADWQSRIRWISVYSVAGNSDDICTSLGDSLGASLTCDPAGSPTTTVGPLGAGSSKLYGSTPRVSTSLWPELWAAAGGAGQTVCLEFGR